MLLLETQMSVALDIVNHQGKTIGHLDALLTSLHGEWATLHILPGLSSSLLHWGTRVRFRIDEDSEHYEVEGTVNKVTSPRSSLPDRPGSSSNAAAHCEGTTAEESQREVAVRLWSCRTCSEQRATPRRRKHCPVLLAPLTPVSRRDGAVSAINALSRSLEPSLVEAWAVDFSGNGMRVRHTTPPLTCTRLGIQFALPITKGVVSEQHCFDLRGRILRQQPAGRHGHCQEIAILFERLSAEDGLALNAYLTAKPTLPEDTP